MAPFLPRMHLFEIDDQTWFPSFLRARVQAALTLAWTTHVPILQRSSPAHLVAKLLYSNLKTTVRDYVFIDFCAGGGGPTPSIEKHLNAALGCSPAPSPAAPVPNGVSASSSPSPPHPSYAAVAAAEAPVRFVLTDLHPHVDDWEKAAALSPNVTFEAGSVDAAHAPAELVGRYKAEGKKVFRLFNLAFHHFDDPLAKAILKNTVETSDGFGIFELQDRNLLGFLTCCLFGLGVLVLAPYYALVWRSPATLFFTYLVPILPFVLVFDGWMSALRTRTPDEVEALLRSCGAAGGDAELARWEVRSGRESFMWPVGSLNWIICVRR
ncbi:hypothetical protein B0T26DRAFT_679190 [Lasiosphaeria miniovina]|uniref:Uncharacterized protein n=1 Tax=Lasiosphaeria miniovina TaxID=1954250 RepID=A0AA40A5Y2_9PEZI|nr:uncharacterized protein B0T26DRAFT_679190 [Lasiosphaeria miniovina]KAK0709825.1 hypothetical protein B0T26DRAFT_679190 [Lasiosphaeria miniovina]